MKQIPLRVLLACAAEIWAIDETYLSIISGILSLRAAGGELSSEEIEARITQKLEHQVQAAPGDIGVLQVQGVLSQKMNLMTDVSGGSSTEQLAADFRGMLADPAIKAIMLNINSPGGTSFGIDELASEIYDSRGAKPIVAQVNSLAASAAYWLACQADEIAVTPGGQAGSIGVYTIHDDISAALEKAGVKQTIIRAGKNKMMAPESEPLSTDAHAVLQDRVAETGRMFTKAVARGRNVSVARVNDSFGQGLMFGAPKLVELGMADRVGTYEDTLGRFGATVNPVAASARASRAARAEEHDAIVAKLKAGDELSPRELEQALRASLGLTNSEAKTAVRLSKGSGQRESDKPAETAVVVAPADIASMQRSIADIRQHLKL